MKVYITYDRYEHDEWFSIYSVGTRKHESIQKFKKEDLPSFICYGPDDCHSFQLQVVEMTKQEYLNFMKWIEDGQSLDSPSDLYNKMVEIYDRSSLVKNQHEVLMCTDGCSDWTEIVDYYGRRTYRDTDDDDVRDEIWTELTDMDEKDLYEKVLKYYIRDTY